MSRSRFARIALLSIVLLLSAPLACPQASADSASAVVTLAAPYHTTSWDDREAQPEPFELPVLYLHRQREAASPEDRTLALDLSGLRGGQIVVEVTSLHADPDTGSSRREAASFVLPARGCTADRPCSLRWTLPPTAASDLYTLRVRDEGDALLWESANPGRPDLALLDTWDLPVDDHTVRIYYATLFPFARGPNDLDDRLSPAGVVDFIESSFAPLVLETWRTQFHTWGFGPIHPRWDADGLVEIVVTCSPFALMGGTGTYTISFYRDGTPYGERRLWWYSSSPNLEPYDTLENGYKAIFAHEFFHMVQWNVMLSVGGSGQRWDNLFIEGQGKFAPSVMVPELELRRGHVRGAVSEYAVAAKHWLQTRLNASFRDLEADRVYRYDTALYWRFLYEQSGDMRIVRAALEEMALGAGPDLEVAVDEVMDAAFTRAGGPFDSFEESLTAFAAANYALRLENGRCAEVDPDACPSRYVDPDSIYSPPALEAELDLQEDAAAYRGTIPALGGADLIEVQLDRQGAGRSLTLSFHGQGARFSVAVWELDSGRGNPAAEKLGSRLGDVAARPRALTPRPQEISIDAEGAGILHLSLDPATCDRLALIVTRLGPASATTPAGDYELTLTAF